MRTLPLNRWQRLEALMGVLVVVALITFVSWSANRLARFLLGGPTVYAQEARDRVDLMLRVLHRGPVQRTIPHRRCYGSDQLSPCVELVTQDGVTMQVLGPSFRLAVMLPVANTDLAVALKRQADHVDRDGVARPGVLSMVLNGMNLGLTEDPAAAQVRATMRLPVQGAVALVPSELHAWHRGAAPTVVDGTLLWQLWSSDAAPAATVEGPMTQDRADSIWWFTVPLVLAGPALDVLRDHPLPPDQRVEP